MKEIKLYQCEVCGTEYTDKKQAEECEENHVETLEIVKCKFVKRALMHDGFPASITVKSDDGREMTYNRCTVI